ncbi:MAG: hypothetical protein LBU05_07715, partial [Bifidobacteriaceae bacterium]|nr:hypothetical protein [Bifidobacteriaceae bacterium]
ADSRETVRELNQRARSERVIAGQVRPDGEVALAGPTRASAGDVVITRRNDRRLVAGRTGWVRNGDRWTVVKTHPGGAVTVRRAGRPRGASVTLPAAYVSEYLDLGYAVTAHRAQRVTVDACHVVVTPATTRENLYVAMTRGRDRNQAWVAVGMPDPAHTVPHPSDQPERDARGVLARVLRNSGAEPSAHQTLAAERELWGGTAQLLAEVETLTAAGDQGRWAALVAACGLDGAQADQAVASEAFGPLCAELRRAEANGIDPRTALPGLVAARPLTGADDIAAVLRHRVAAHTDQAAQTRRARPPQRYILALLPAPSDRLDPGTRHAIGQRIDALTVRAQTVLDRAAANSEPWLARLGPRPVRPQTARRWDQAALAVAAYRDRWDETGPEPLGQPQTPPQRQHAARVNTLIADIDADRAPARTAPSPRRDHGPTL